jgi:hypothetical protein
VISGIELTGTQGNIALRVDDIRLLTGLEAQTAYGTVLSYQIAEAPDVRTVFVLADGRVLVIDIDSRTENIYEEIRTIDIIDENTIYEVAA